MKSMADLSISTEHRPNGRLLLQFWSATFLQKGLAIANLIGKLYAIVCRIDT